VSVIDLLPDIQTEEDLQGIFEENSVSTDNIGTDTAISETEHNTDTETETDATMSDTDNITDTDGQSACTCWPDWALFHARLVSIFAISDKLSLESTGGISLPESALLRGFMQEGVIAIPASLTSLWLV
jgi:hypothetical protein